MVDSGTVCDIITKGLAKDTPKTEPTVQRTNSTNEKDSKIFSNEPIKVLGKLATTVTYNNWTRDNAFFTVVDNGQKNIRVRDPFHNLGLAVVQ